MGDCEVGSRHGVKLEPLDTTPVVPTRKLGATNQNSSQTGAATNSPAYDRCKSPAEEESFAESLQKSGYDMAVVEKVQVEPALQQQQKEDLAFAEAVNFGYLPGTQANESPKQDELETLQKLGYDYEALSRHQNQVQDEDELRQLELGMEKLQKQGYCLPSDE